MPPSWAMVIARRASVTVSMAADSSGTFSRMRARDAGGKVDLAWQNFRVGRDEEDVVEGESFFEDAHAQL